MQATKRLTVKVKQSKLIISFATTPLMSDICIIAVQKEKDL